MQTARNNRSPSRVVGWANLSPQLRTGVYLPRGREGHARVAVLTVIDEEMDAALEVLEAETEAGDTGVLTSRRAWEQRGPNALPFVVAKCLDRSNEPAGQSARDLMEDWRPETIILTGIAGGIRRLQHDADGARLDDGPELGDVVVANMIHFGDYGKDTPTGFLPRFMPLVHPSSGLIRTHTEFLRVSRTWGDVVADRRPTAGSPRLRVGELVAVEAVAGNPFAERQQHMIDFFDKAVAVDMESKGVARALQDYTADVGVHYHPRWLCVRGISDLVVGGDEAAGLLGTGNNEERALWKPYAALTAAHVTKAICDRLVRKARPAHPAQPAMDPWPPVV